MPPAPGHSSRCPPTCRYSRASRSRCPMMPAAAIRRTTTSGSRASTSPSATTPRCTSATRCRISRRSRARTRRSPYDGFDTGYLNKNHNILASLTKVYGSTFTTQTKVTWNRLLGDQPLNGDYQPTLYMNPTDAGQSAGLPHRVSRLPALQPGQRHSIRRSAEACCSSTRIRPGSAASTTSGSAVPTCTSPTIGRSGRTPTRSKPLNTTSAALPSLDNFVLGQIAPVPDRDQSGRLPRWHLCRRR